MEIKPCIIGIDFGTTSLSAVAINIETRQIERVFCRNTNSYISSDDSLVREQSVENLTKLFLSLLDEIDTIPSIEVKAYGFTGQMHGIIGLDANNQAVTNLVTWEDKNGETILPDGERLLDKIRRLGDDNTLSCGYGIVTLYKWLKVEKRADIHCFSTVADYFAGLLTGTIAMSPTMAHSIGLFDIVSNSWKESSINRLGLPIEIFPKIVDEAAIIGYTSRRSENIPVVSAIGDNQASFMGSVLDKKKSALLNIGTGAQISVLINREEMNVYRKYVDGFDTQFRPYDKDSLLIATGFVNGGTTYKSLFSFFETIGKTLFNLKDIDDNELWRNMEKVARDVTDHEDKLLVTPLLAGQRKYPDKRGEIINITASNLFPGNLIKGFLTGLAEYYKSGFFPEMSDKVEYICGSGNGLKKNMLLVEIVEKTFQKPVHLSPFNEEASVGAALNAIKALMVTKDEEESRAFLLDLSRNLLTEN